MSSNTEKLKTCFVDRSGFTADNSKLFRFLDTNHGPSVGRITYSFLRPLFPPESSSPELMDGDIAVRRTAYQKTVVENYIDFITDVLEDPLRGLDEELLAVAKKKPYRALQRLKDKGQYASDFKSLWAKMDFHGGFTFIMTFGRFLAMTSGMLAPTETFEITDDMWISAIELYMSLEYPKIFVDPTNDQQWIGFLLENPPLLFTLVFYISILSYYSTFCYDNLDNFSDDAALKNDLSQANGALVAMYDEAANMAGEIDEMSEEMSELRAQLDASRREAQLLRSRMEVLERKCGEQSGSGLSSLDAIPKAEVPVPDVSSEKSGNIAAKNAAFSFWKDLRDLPEDGILFVGGHPNMLSKLKPMHPGWTFVTTDVSVAALPRDMQPKHIFVYSSHLSHSLFARLHARYASVPTGYVTSTNLDRLHHEMRVLFTVECQKSEAAGNGVMDSCP